MAGLPASGSFTATGHGRRLESKKISGNQCSRIPSYYDYNDQECGPACPTCVDTRLVFDAETSTYEVIERLN